MAEYIFLTSMLAVFLLRDVQLLTTEGDCRRKIRLVTYGVTQMFTVAIFVLLFLRLVVSSL